MDTARKLFIVMALAGASIPANGTTIGTSSYLQANLGWMPFNSYNTTDLAANYGFSGTINGTYYSSCPANASVESCFTTIMGQLKTQGVTGVRIFIPLCDAFPACGSSASWNPSQNPAQQTWITNVGNFFQDVKNAGIQNVTITITADGTTASVPASQASSPSGSCSICGNCSADVGQNVKFDPLVPYGISDGTASACTGIAGGLGEPLGAFWPTNSNQGYNLAPINNQNFIGWTNYFNAINAVLQKAHGIVTVFGLEISQELDPADFTAQVRYFYDNSSPGTAPAQYVTTVNNVSYANVYAALRNLMSSNGFDAGRVFYSMPWIDATAAAYNCGDVYQDYARALSLDETTQTINGGFIGIPSDKNVINGLVCGGTYGTGGNMIASPFYSPQPDIVDAHIYPTVSGVTNTDSMIQQEAATDYGDLPHFLVEAGLTSATIVIGETWGGTLSPLYLNATSGYCWNTGNLNVQAPSGAPSDNVAGFNNEGVSNPLSAYTVTFRPWMNLGWLSGACFNYGSGPGSSNNYQSLNYNGQGPYTPTNQ